MLCATRHETMTYITIRGLDQVQVNAFSCVTQYSTVILSWDLLAWISVEGRIPSSFTNFITTPELSGSLYISPDIYHTQVTEYSLQTIYQLSSFLSLCIEHLSLIVVLVRPSPFYRFVRRDWSFREHLYRALKTEMIFYLLRSIRSECLIRDYFSELMLDTLKIIFKWLQVSFI